MSQGRRPRTAGDTAHELCNVVGALQLRFGVLRSDPTCRWAQQENIEAMGGLLTQAMKLARTIEAGAPLPGAALLGTGRRRTLSPKRR